MTKKQIKELRQYENAKIPKEMLPGIKYILDEIDTGMTLSISIYEDEQIKITYWKNF